MVDVTHARRVRRRQRGRMLAGVMLALVGVTVAGVAFHSVTRLHISACALLSAPELSEIRIDTIPKPFYADPPGAHATGCWFSQSTGAAAQVFAMSSGGRAYFRVLDTQSPARNVARHDISGPGFRAFITSGPDVPRAGTTQSSEALFVLKGDRYANLNLFGEPPGTVSRLARSVASRL